MTTSRRGKIPQAPRPEAWLPVEWTTEEAGAIQAVMYGRATDGQQLAAMKFIVERICGTYDQSYRPSSDRDTAFAEGKRYVGLQLVKLAKLNLARLRSTQSEQGEDPKENA